MDTYIKKGRLLLVLLTLFVGGMSPTWAQKDLPYEYGFENNDLATDGWSKVFTTDLTNNNNECGINTGAKKTGTYGFRFSSFNTRGANEQILISPELNATKGVVVSFSYAASSTSSGGELFKVGYSTTDAEVTSFAWGEEYSTKSISWATFNETFPAGTKYIAIKYYANYQYRLYIDDVTFEEAPSCIAPKALTATNSTSNTVVLSWTSDADTWNVAYKKTSDSDWTTIENVTTNPYTLNKLDDSSNYEVKVQTNCGGGDLSDWTNTVSFSTLQVAVQADDGYTDDFEKECKWQFVNGTLTNAWVWGEATNNTEGGSKALYISNDGGTTNAYANSSSTLVYATKLFSFEGGTYKFTYDWIGNGESNYDFLRVALVPSSVTLTAGTNLITGFTANGLPEGWIALDGGSQLNGVTNWQNKSTEVAVANGTYYVVFAWRNDGSGGTNPAAAIDNFSIAVQSCPTPSGLAISDITAQGATLTWATSNNTWEVYCSESEETPANDVTVTGKTDTNSYTFTKLKSETKYYVWVRAISGDDKSDWAGTNFTTLISCPVPTALSTSSVTNDSAVLTWTAGSDGQDAWDVEYSTNSDFSISKIVNVSTEATTTLTDLTSSTTYYVRVRANCGGGDYSKWTDAISFSTLQIAVSADDGYADDFEDVNNWMFVNGTQTNAWAWGTAAQKDGEKGLYISNDGGATNYYDTSAASVVYAKKLFSFAGGAYVISYDWNGNGESTYDYMRVALAPADVELTSGALVSGISASALPAGWIALDGGNKLNVVTEWQHKNIELSLEAGQYNVVFVWRNDNMYGTNPPAAIDNFNINILSCPIPSDLAVTDVTAHEATLIWTASENTWEVYCSTSEETPAADAEVTGTASENAYTFTGLKGDTKYYVWVRSVSGDNRSEWTGTNFTTEPSCIVPTALTITKITDKSAIITWTKGSEDQTKWEVSYSTTSGTPNDGTIVAVTETNYELTNLTNGTTYYVYVRGVNSDDDKSVWSEVLEVTPGVFTVNNGTTTNQYVPVYGYYADNSTGIRSQFIIPSTDIAGIANSEISKMVFYSSNANVTWGNGTFDVYLNEVEATEFASATLIDWSSLTKVFSGKLSITGNQMTVTFEEPFEYHNGNLLIGVCQTAKGSEGRSNWYGVTTASYASIGGYATSLSRYQFLPKASFYYSPISDEAKLVVSTETLAFGKVKPTATDEEKQLTFAIKNKGKADLKGITISYSGDDAFSTSAVSDATIAAGGENIVVTVTINTETPGDFAGTITVKATDQEDATIAISGTVIDANKMFEDFAGNTLPEDWTTQGIGSYTTGNTASSYTWNFANGYARYYFAPSLAGSLDYYKHSLVSPFMEFAEGGEKVAFRMKKETQYAGYISYLLVQYTTDGTTWTDTEEGAFNNANIPEDWTDAEVTIPADAKKIRFVATGIAIDDIYGGKIAEIPVFTFAQPTDLNFGAIKADVTSEVYTVQNTGRAELTGLSVTSDNESFVVTVADNAASIAAKSSATFTVTMKADVKGLQNGTITVKADGADAVTFNVSGYVLDTDAILVDFADNELPNGWTKSSFNISNNEAYYNGYVATLVSPTVTVAEGEKLVIYARGTNTRNAQLDVKTSIDNGTTWSDAVKTFTTELRQNTTDYVLLTVDNITAGNYKLKLTGDYVAISVINGYHYNQNSPALGVTLEGVNIATGYNDNFGTKVKESIKHTYTIKNTGTGTLTGTITSSVPAHFTVSESEFTLAKDETLNVDVTVVVDETFGDKASVITIHPTIDGLTDIVINVSATTKDPNVWEEDFENGMPAFWTTTGWTVSTPLFGGNGTKIIGPSNNTTATLTTPRLQATEGQSLKFDVIGAESETYSIKMQYSTDEQETWSDIVTYTDEGTKEFTAPSDGYYYLRFTGNYTYLDNFEGFKLALPDHIAAITSFNVPSYDLKQGNSFNATVTVKESRGVEEELTAKIYMDDVEIGTATGSVSANGSTTITITATPTAANDEAQIYIAVEYAGGTIKSDVVTRNVSARITLALNENSTDEIVAGTYDDVTLTRTYTTGWNTVILPFAANVSVFGENAVIFKFDNYTDGELKFTKVTNGELTYGTPYILYVPNAISEPLEFHDVTINSMAIGDENTSVTRNGASFRGTYAPMPAGTMTGKYGVTPSAQIARGTAEASMKGFRAYIELPEGASARLSFFDFDGTTLIKTIELQDNADGTVYNLKGQRVENIKKGNLYIINGKKQIRK